MNNFTTPYKMSGETRNELFVYYSQIPNTGFHLDYVTKRMGLMMIGLLEEEAEEMCKEKPIDREQVLKNVKREQEKELRRLAKWSREQRMAAKLIESDPIYKNVIEIEFIEQDIPFDLKTIDK
jgi:hypothetical protein